MTNAEIIISEAVEHGIYTKEQIDEFLAIGQLPPIHTYAEWRYFGYKVKKGEHAAFATKLWKIAPPKKDEDGNETEEPHYIMVKSYLFDASQVERYLEGTK